MYKLVKKIILPAVLFCAFFALYLHNLSRVVYGGDVGDLVTAAALGGVAHPPGYPLFTLLGFLLVRFPFLHSPAFAVGLISVFSGALGILFFFLLTKQLTKSTLAAVVSATLLGCSFLYWFYSEIAEVFALNAFFAIILFFLAILYRRVQKPIVFIFFFFFLGLSFTNHQTIILIVPSLFLLIGKTAFVQAKKNLLLLVWSLLAFFIGLIPFVYIFIAASKNPLINWDAVHDIPSFLHLILRKDYGTLQAGIFDAPSLPQRIVTANLYFQSLLTTFTIPAIFITFIGFFDLFRKEKVVFAAITLAWILSGPAFVMYAGFPLTSNFIIGAYERFSLLSTIIFLIPFGVGLVVLSQFLASLLPKRHYDILFQSIFLIIPLMLFVYNFPKTNLSTVTIGQTYAEDFIRPLPKNAVLLISGDTEIFNTWYVHYVLKERPDVLLYNIGATPVTQNSIGQELKNIPQKDRSHALVAIVQKMQRTRPIFSNTKFQSVNKDTITWVPYGLVYQMYQSEDVLPTENDYLMQADSVWKQLRVPTKKNMSSLSNHSLTIVDIPTNYSNSYSAMATYVYSQYKDTQKALELFDKAKEISPDNDKVYAALGILYTTIPDKCHETVFNLSTSLQLNPYQQLPYFILYNTYATCLKDMGSAKNVQDSYTKLFQKDFAAEAKKSQNSLTGTLQ